MGQEKSKRKGSDLELSLFNQKTYNSRPDPQTIAFFDFLRDHQGNAHVLIFADLMHYCVYFECPLGRDFQRHWNTRRERFTCSNLYCRMMYLPSILIENHCEFFTMYCRFSFNPNMKVLVQQHRRHKKKHLEPQNALPISEFLTKTNRPELLLPVNF